MSSRLARCLLLLAGLLLLASPAQAQAQKTHKHKPVTVKVSTRGRTRSAVIDPADGGTLTATGRDGTVYTLSVPSGALLGPEKVSMTPLGSVKGLPKKARLVAGVKLGPQGLALFAPATLRVHPKHAFTKAQLKRYGAVGFEGSGTQARSLAVLPDPDQANDNVYGQKADIVMTLLHFSGGLISSRIDTLTPTGYTPQSRLDALIAQVSKALETAHERALAGDGEATVPPSVAKNADRALDEVALPLALRLQKQSIPKLSEISELARLTLGLERQIQILGGEGNGATFQRIFTIIHAAADRLRKHYTHECLAHAVVPGFAINLLRLERERQLLGMSDEGGLSDALACLKQKFRVSVSGTTRLVGKTNEIVLTQGTTTGFSAVAASGKGTITTGPFTLDPYGFHGNGSLSFLGGTVTPDGSQYCGARWNGLGDGSALDVLVSPELNELGTEKHNVFVKVGVQDEDELTVTGCGPLAESHTELDQGILARGAPQPFIVEVPIGGTARTQAPASDPLLQYRVAGANFTVRATQIVK